VEGRGCCCWLDDVDAGAKDPLDKALDCCYCTDALGRVDEANGDDRCDKAATVLGREGRDDVVGAAVVVGGSWESADYYRFGEEEDVGVRGESDADYDFRWRLPPPLRKWRFCCRVEEKAAATRRSSIESPPLRGRDFRFGDMTKLLRAGRMRGRWHLCRGN